MCGRREVEAEAEVEAEVEADAEVEANAATAFVGWALQQRERGALSLLRLQRPCARRREVLANVIGRRLVRHLGHAGRRQRDRPRVRPDQLLRQMLCMIYRLWAASCVDVYRTIAGVGVNVIRRARRKRGIVLQLGHSVTLAPVPPRGVTHLKRELVHEAFETDFFKLGVAKIRVHGRKDKIDKIKIDKR